MDSVETTPTGAARSKAAEGVKGTWRQGGPEAGRQPWLVLLPQLPSSPSSLRVAVWRRLRAAGATSYGGVWLLPATAQHQQLVATLVADLERQGAGALLLRATAWDEAAESQIVQRFRQDRDQEYTEFCQRCRDFLEEIRRETAQDNFSFAELEENEEDLAKLRGWLQKIQARDLFGAGLAEEAVAALRQCEVTLHEFAQAVYAREGLAPEAGGEAP